MTQSVTILMATLNGGKYLECQLKSIFQQSHKNWRLMISDDGSVDDTLNIINDFIFSNPNCNVKLLKGPQLGFAQNFLNMLKYVDTDYACFCDQDDIWLPDKLSYSISKLTSRSVPSVYGSRTLLIDAKGSFLGKSPKFKKPAVFRNALVQSIAGGNTMMLNAPAINLLSKVYSKGYIPVSHDWWVYLLISGAGGEILYDSCPKVFYRQHEKNIIGSNKSFVGRIYRIRLLLLGQYKLWTDINIDILLKVSYILTYENKKILDEFVRARKLPLFKRYSLMRQIGLYRQTWFGNLAFQLCILLNKI